MQNTVNLLYVHQKNIQKNKFGKHEDIKLYKSSIRQMHKHKVAQILKEITFQQVILLINKCSRLEKVRFIRKMRQYNCKC